MKTNYLKTFVLYVEYLLKTNKLILICQTKVLIFVRIKKWILYYTILYYYYINNVYLG